MNTKASVKTVEQLVSETQAVIRDAIARATRSADRLAEEAIRGSMRTHLLELLGVEQDYNGKWKLHGNTSGPLQQQLRLVVEARALELLKLLGEVTIELSPRELRALRKSYRDAYLSELQGRMQEFARKHAIERAASDVAALLGSVEAVDRLVGRG